MELGILHRFEYEDKTAWAKTADTLLLPSRFALGGKLIDGYKLDRTRATFIESHPPEDRLSTIILKVIAVVVSLLGSPLFVIALGIKYFDAKNTKVTTRYLAKSKKDKFYPRPRLGNDLITTVAVRLFMKYMGLDQLTASMQIQGDKILDTFSFGDYEGGLGLPIADIIQEKLRPYTEETTDFSSACFNAAKALNSYQDLSKKMIPIMISRFFPIGWLFNRDKYCADLALDMRDELQRMKRGQRMMLPLTFYAPAKGYRTITLSFTYVGQKKYEWRIYRSHVGPEGKVHAPFWKVDRIPGLCLKGITKDQISDSEFLKKIIKFGTIQKYDQGERFFKFVREFVQENRRIRFSKDIASSRPQKAAVDTMKSINFALKDIMGKEHYNQYKLLSRIDNLIELNKAIESHELANPDQLDDATRLFTLAKRDMQRRLDNFQKYFGTKEPAQILNEKQQKIMNLSH